MGSKVGHNLLLDAGILLIFGDLGYSELECLYNLYKLFKRYFIDDIGSIFVVGSKVGHSLLLDAGILLIFGDFRYSELDIKVID